MKQNSLFLCFNLGCSLSDVLLFDNRDRHINRGSYMSAHVLLNLLNKLGKSDKMRGLPLHYITFSQRV